MEERTYFVYIMSSLSRTIYTGVTNSLIRRVAEHKEGKPGSFTARYNVNRLVYGACPAKGALRRHPLRDRLREAIKRMLRAQKVRLIESMNPQWNDLSEE